MAMGEQSPIVGELAAELLDAGAPIERRIGALFSLRNILTEDSAAALAKGGRPPTIPPSPQPLLLAPFSEMRRRYSAQWGELHWRRGATGQRFIASHLGLRKQGLRFTPS